MKSRFLTIVCLLLVALISCNEEEVDRTYLEKLRIFKYDRAYDTLRYDGLYDDETQHLEPMEGVKVSFYESEADYIGNKNPVYEAISDANGYLEYKQKASFVNYFVRAEKGEYSALRQGQNLYGMFDDLQCSGDCDHYEYMTLTLVPSRLTIRVYNSNGEPVSGAHVEVFPTEQDYLEKNGSWIYEAYEMGSTTRNPGIVYYGLTNAVGEITFTNLAPKVFWFRVKSSQGNNDNGLNHLTEPLPADPEITSVVEVTVK